MSSTDLIDQFLDAVWVEQGLSKNTLSAYSSDLRIFAKWLSDKSMLDVDKGDLSRFLAARYEAGIGNRSTARILSSLRRFYGYYIRENSLIIDPTLLIESPHIGRPLPISLSELDVELLLNAPEVTNTNGFRDKTMLEVLYATGLRVSELVGLKFEQISFRQGVVRIIGKGNKERLVPVGEEAISWLEAYMIQARKKLLGERQCDYLFVTNRGDGMTRQAFWHIIKRHAKKAGISKELSPHTLRHAFATHLLNKGADLNAIKDLLGHTSLAATQVYTHNSLDKLKAIFEQAHPKA